MSEQSPFSRHYTLKDGAFWSWSVTDLNNNLNKKEGGLTGYRVEVVYQQGPVRFRGAVHVEVTSATRKPPVALEASTRFAALAYPIAMEISLPPKVSKDLAGAIARAVERVGRR
jgi:hypothetical protein